MHFARADSMRGVNNYMTVINSDGDIGMLQASLAVAENDFAQALGQMNTAIRALKTTSDVVARQNADQARNLGDVSQALFQERAQVDDDDQSNSDGKGGYALDFDSARLEIGRRMARLRAIK